MGKSKSKNPAYPDADPTAPGGMSQQALVDELINKHGYTEAELGSWRKGEKWRLDAWPRMIDAVVAERRNREREAVAPAEVITADPTLRTPTPLFIGMPDSKDYIFDGHYGASPSGAERWMKCTASLGAARAFLETLTPNQQVEFARSSTAARQGTTAHAAAEAEARLMLGEIDDAEYASTLMELSVVPDTEGEAYSDEMAEYVTEYTDLIKSYLDEGREVLIEHRVKATVELTTVDQDGEYNLHDIVGSADTIVIPSPEHPTLVVMDLKYGEGTEVSAVRNPQTRIYALGALAEVLERLDLDSLPDWLTEVEYVIAQPRLGGIKTWSEPIDDLLDWSENALSLALTEALGGAKAGAAFVPGDEQCQWCPARGTCPALAEQRMAAASELFDVIQATEYETGIEGAFPETGTLDGARLGSLLSQIKGLVSIYDDLKAEAQRRLHRGEDVAGFHLVNYTPPRKWLPGAAEELDEVAALWTKSMVSPTQAEKVLGPKGYAEIEEYVDKPAIRPVVGPINDRRKAWTGVPPEQMFSNLEDE